jgi:hypothetical protein
MGSIDLEWVKLKQALEYANRKVVEQSLIFIEKMFILAKGKVEWLEGQNESHIKTT